MISSEPTPQMMRSGSSRAPRQWRRAAGMVGIGITVQRLRGADHRLARLVRRPERVLVRGQFHHILDARDLCGAALVKGDLHDARVAGAMVVGSAT